MSKFDELLEDHAQISIEIGHAEDYLKSLVEDREAISRKLKSLAKDETGKSEEEEGIVSRALRAGDSLEETAKIVAELGDSVTAAQLAERLDLTQDAARLRLQRAEKRRLIKRVAFGRYAAKPERARSPANSTKPSERGNKEENTAT
jgi:predicted HTH transcriptional regulator